MASEEEQDDTTNNIFFYVDWQDVQDKIRQLTEYLTKVKYKPQRILGVSRGGSVIAVMLSHFMNINGADVDHIKVSSYGEDRQAKQPIISEMTLLQRGLWNNGATLIIDDLFDKGGTYNVLHKELPYAKKAFLWHKYPIQAVLDSGLDNHNIIYKGEYAYENDWLIFPWEEWQKTQ